MDGEFYCLPPALPMASARKSRCRIDIRRFHPVFGYYPFCPCRLGNLPSHPPRLNPDPAQHQLLITIITALALKLTLSLRGLDHAAREVQSALETNNLPEARRLLSWHLVSRDTSQLGESKVSAAAIESVAENASDGIVAPLFFFALGGLPAAFAYRFINTADSMLGYHDEEREWLGKVPARLDDLLNFIPARLAGLFIVLSAPFCGASLSQAWKIMWRDSGQTASPNAGIPMSAMAGSLGVELEKIDHYALGKGLRLPDSVDLARARRMLVVAVGFAALVFSLWSFYVQPR